MTTIIPSGRQGGEARQLHVLVVDDSAMVRQVMQAILTTDRRIRVTVAADPLLAFPKIEKDPPDVIITDLEMQHMDGLSFVRKIMVESPIPMVICSGLAATGTELVLRALEHGAVEVINKPQLGVREFLHESAVRLLDTVWSAAEARVGAAPAKKTAPLPSASGAEIATEIKSAFVAPARSLVAIGASTGGTEAIRVVLAAMPPDCPPIVVVQHMPEGFTRAFAQRLSSECAIQVKEAQDGDSLHRGEALIAPGNFHTMVERSGRGYAVKVVDGP